MMELVDVGNIDVDLHEAQPKLRRSALTSGGDSAGCGTGQNSGD